MCFQVKFWIQVTSYLKNSIKCNKYFAHHTQKYVKMMKIFVFKNLKMILFYLLKILIEFGVDLNMFFLIYQLYVTELMIIETDARK